LSNARRILCIRGNSEQPLELPFSVDESTEVVTTHSITHALVMVGREKFDGLFVCPNALERAIDLGQLIRSDLILEQMPDGVVMLDASNHVIWANKKICEWTDVKETYDKNFYELFLNPDILGPDFCPFHTAVSTGRASSSTLRVGENRYFQMHAAPIFDRDQQPPNLIVSLRDVTTETIQRQKLEAIHRAGLELADLTADEVMEMGIEERIELLKSNILQYTKDLLKFDVIEVRLLDPDTQSLEPLLSVGLSERASRRPLFARAKGNGVTGFVAATGKSYLCEDTRQDPLYIDGLDGAKSSLTVPLILHEEVIGSFNVESPDVGGFTESDLQFLEIFARDLAVALNTLELLVAQKADALQRGVEAIHGAVALPVDEILNDTVNVIEKYIGHDPDVVKRLQSILKNARDIKQVIQNVGQRMTPTIAIPASQRNAQRTNLRNARVLVIDSDEAVRNDAHTLLERYGCIVETAHEGDEALMMIRNCSEVEKYNAIISDIRLPDMNGHELMVRLKDQIADPPLILMTGFGYDPGHAIVKARREGLRPNAVLYKPFRLDQLLETVEAMLSPVESVS
jgi:CheY-like chemotaxis protein/PAS domain-containing protein